MPTTHQHTDTQMAICFDVPAKEWLTTGEVVDALRGVVSEQQVRNDFDRGKLWGMDSSQLYQRESGRRKIHISSFLLYADRMQTLQRQDVPDQFLQAFRHFKDDPETRQRILQTLTHYDKVKRA